MVFNLADKIEVFLDANFYLLIPHSSMNSIANIFIKLMENKVILISIDGMRPDGFLACKNPYIEIISKKEALDIDDIEDYKMCQAMW